MYIVSSATVEASMTWYNLLYNCSCEGDNIISILPQGLGSTGPPSNFWVPMLDNVSASFVCIVAMSLCMCRFLGILWTSVYFAEWSFMVWHANLIFQPGTLIQVALQNSPWRDLLQFTFNLVHIGTLWLSLVPVVAFLGHLETLCYPFLD
jgi:hypothetical protein